MDSDPNQHSLDTYWSKASLYNDEKQASFQLIMYNRQTKKAPMKRIRYLIHVLNSHGGANFSFEVFDESARKVARWQMPTCTNMAKLGSVWFETIVIPKLFNNGVHSVRNWISNNGDEEGRNRAACPQGLLAWRH
uniref:YTH domain-containing protein n=1 Tax=Panagrellus redivivus TaxID=6233 RepID=A0A7E4UVH5_PANRE